jgi:hypothetical protein
VAKVRCLICNSPAMRLYVDTMLDKGLTNAGIGAGVADMGGKLDPDVVGRHKASHWTKPERTEGPKPTKRDLAVLIRDKTYEAVEDFTPDALLIMGKELAPMVNAGLKAEAIIDKRNVNEKKLGIAAGALSLQAWLAGMGKSTAPPPELDDGNTIEGEAREV